MRLKKILFLSVILFAIGITANAAEIQTTTTVDKNIDSPTGYFVTFRLDNPNTDRVRVKGEWMFSDPTDATCITGTEADPYHWKNGYVVWTCESIFSNSGLPVFDLNKNEETGIWELQMPLPSGTFKYKFYVGGVGDDLNDLKNAQEVIDPANPPYHRDPSTGRLTGEDTYCFVYVPYDPLKQSLCEDRSIEAPRATEKGSVSFEIIQSSIDSSKIKLGVYLPYGFDADRAEKYPLLVVYHGGGGCESSWFNNGLANILDNLIAGGRMEPTVVITPNASDYRWNREKIDLDLGASIIPYTIEKYNVDQSVERRAIAGLSMGGATIMYTVINHPELFSKYLSMSAPFTSDISHEITNPKTKDITIVITAGLYDFVKVDGLLDPVMRQRYRGFEGSVYQYMYDMRDNGVKFHTRPEPPMGHAWVLWRDDLVYFIEKYL